MLGKLTVPHDLSKKLPGQGVELLSVTDHVGDVQLFVDEQHRGGGRWP
jgi:hypothetical protein